MRFEVVSWNRKGIDRELRAAAGRLKYTLDSRSPEFVICMGGDGTFLYGEQVYPGVPKILIKHRCGKCRSHQLEKILKAVEYGKYKVVKEMKVQGTVNGSPRKRLVGLNEINIHYKLPCAIGLDVWIDGKKREEGVIGDGLIAATPYGSTGYFKSITRRTFKRGIGLAFNNPVKRIPSRVLPEKSDIRVKVVKHSGWMAADCNLKLIPLKTGDTVEIRKHPEPARIVRLKGRKEKVKF